MEAIERTRAEGVFATGITEEICRRIGPGSLDPASVQVGDYEGERQWPGGGTM